MTDKQCDIVHPTFFAGGGYQAKFPNFVGSTNLPVYWMGRVGIARIDRPSISGTNVVFTSMGGLLQPQFHGTWAPTMGTTITVPINSTINLQAGGNV